MRMAKKLGLALLLAIATTATAGAQLYPTSPYADCDGWVLDPDYLIGACTAALETDPSPGAARQVVIHTNRARAYQRKGDVDQAIADFGRAIAIDPRHAQAYWGRGAAYLQKGDYPRAIADLDTTIGLSPKDAAAYYNRGVAKYLSHQLDGALADFDTAIEIRPGYANAYVGRATVYEEKGEREKAIADFRFALAHDPKVRFAEEGLRRLGTTQYP